MCDDSSQAHGLRSVGRRALLGNRPPTDRSPWAWGLTPVYSATAGRHLLLGHLAEGAAVLLRDQLELGVGRGRLALLGFGIGLGEHDRMYGHPGLLRIEAGELTGDIFLGGDEAVGHEEDHVGLGLELE